MSRRKPYEFVEPKPGTPVYWTSLEELDQIKTNAEKWPELRQRLAAVEFPEGASEGPKDDVSRRTFLELMSAGIALATLEGCRRPVEKVLPYTRMPEEVIPGTASHYATVINRRGEALGLLVESHEGRPTKIEGNPDHPASLGATDLITQASVLDLYDPDRSRQPMMNGRDDKSYDEFDHALQALTQALAGRGGAGLHVLAEPTNSPTFVRVRGEFLRRFPQAKFHTYEAASLTNAREGARLAFGAPVNVVAAYDRAKVILSLDSDFLQTEPGSVRAMKAFANGRKLRSAADGMNRLYVVEPAYTVTGFNADHRLRLAARDVQGYLLALAKQLATAHGLGALGGLGAAVSGAATPQGVPAHWIEIVARDLADNRGASVLVAGSRQPPAVHALVHAINDALGNVGTTVAYTPVADADEPEHVGDLQALAQALDAQQVEALVILGGNPVYDAPADLDFAAKLAKARTSIHLSSHRDETSLRCTWHVPRNHYLESWGDQRSMDGTVSVQQPLIRPLFYGRSEIELLAQLMGEGPRDGYTLVRQTLQGTGGAAGLAFDRAWRRALHQGMVENAMQGGAVGGLRAAGVGQALGANNAAASAGGALGKGNLEVVFQVDQKVLDGRYANNAWLKELPDPVTKITWDNAALLSPATARELGVESHDVIRVTRGNRSVEIVAWVVPGHADWSITLPLGYGREHAGRIGSPRVMPGPAGLGNSHQTDPSDVRGFNVYPLRTTDAMWFASGATVQNTGRKYFIAQTQEHNRMEGRPIAVEATYAEYQEHPNFAERLSPTPRTLPLWREAEYTGHKWGMAIDLTTCTGCNACAVACQSENNVPVVGKDQVSRGREMYWLRIDRYFVGGADDPGVTSQPLMCVQCEEAPCENVCPVNATTHSPEGLNDMAYNRCIGTRYCSNNCPYKVRRFNYLNWHNDGPYQPQDPDVPETVRMQHNPNVSVRFRGVMEKCTYCVQRIQTVKIAAKRENRRIEDGEIVTACAQSCPADAIVFGDLNDPNARVTRLTNADRKYRLLAELGTQPRTSYLARVRNPNPAMPSTRNEGEEAHA